MQEFSSAQRDYPLARLGLDPTQPFYDLNLAGTQGVPTPQMLAQPEHTPEIVLPDFGTQDYAIPAVQPYDLTSPSITYMPEFAADPALPGLDAYAQPYDVDVRGMDVDAPIAHDVPSQDEIAGSLYPGLGFTTLTVHSNVTDVDPLVPDLQNPDLTQQVQRPEDERPGDLDPSALDALHGTPYYQQSMATSYPEVWMNAGGVNNTRARHLSLLNTGLEQ